LGVHSTEGFRTRATGDADSERIQAQGAADATKLKADAAICEYEVDAAGKRALNDAANLLSEKMIAMQVRLAPGPGFNGRFISDCAHPLPPTAMSRPFFIDMMDKSL
jgi:hypothetical protein